MARGGRHSPAQRQESRRLAGARWAKAAPCCLELCFAGLSGLAVFAWLVPRSLLAGLAGGLLGAATVFSLALYTLIWPDPLLRSLEGFALQYGAHPADMILWVYAPELLLIAVQSGSLVALSGFVPPLPARAALWVGLQVLALLPSLAKRRKHLGALLAGARRSER